MQLFLFYYFPCSCSVYRLPVMWQLPFLIFFFECYSLSSSHFSYYFMSENEDGYPFRAQEPQHSHMVDKRGRLYNTRYFIIKSLNHQNIQLSIDKGIWATQLMNEPILEEAFHVKAILFWSYLVFQVYMFYTGAFSCLAEFWYSYFSI